MDKSDKIKTAKNYIEQLANGIDPITGNEVPEGDVINNVKISRCLFFVSKILEEKIESSEKGEPKKTFSQKEKFYISREDLDSSFKFSERAVSGSEITERINSIIGSDNMQKLKLKSINKWLTNIGMLEDEESERGIRKKPTTEGEEIGIVQKVSVYSGYTFNAYTKKAQHFIIDNIDAIIAVNNEKQ